MITAFALISLGSGLLAFIVSLLIWTKVRVLKLQIDILSMRLDFRTRARQMGKLSDSHVCSLDKTFANIVDKSHLFTTSSFVYSMMVDDRDGEDPFKGVMDDELLVVLRHALTQVASRLMFYLTSETVSGIAVGAMVVATMGTLQKLEVLSNCAKLVWSSFGPPSHAAA